MNLEILANTIEKDLSVSLHVASLQYIERAIENYTNSAIVAHDLRVILYARKAKGIDRRIKTYAQYLNRGATDTGLTETLLV